MSTSRSDDGPATAEPSATPAAPGATQTEPGAKRESVTLADDVVETSHVLARAAGDLHYTATTGRIVLREELHDGGRFQGLKPKAELFVTSYVLDGGDPRLRPVTFAFNGGPGSSSVWLHLGLLGPKRVLMGDAGDLLAPPYGLADNAETLLAHSDLVFIDPVSTGYSRMAPGEPTAEYHGFGRDIDAVAELIRLWTTRHGRWMSPKYLAGESYGTTRASAVAAQLQSRFGLYLNGIILISSVIDMGTIRFTEGNDLSAALYLPTYACLAHYHGLHGDRSLEEVRRQAEDLAEHDYPHALARGARLTSDERADMARRVAEVTGLSPRYVEQVNLRIEHKRFFRELLRGRGEIIGRLDGRYRGWDTDDGGEQASFDPSDAAIRGPYGAALNHYVRADLGYESDLTYQILTDDVQPWSYSEFEGRAVSVSSMLAQALRHNPHLRVYLACGYYDGATPYYAAEHAFAHLAIPSQLQGNIEVHYYDAGHMMYVHEPSRLRQSADIARFVAGTAPSARV
jgi:carboxypeptidase C (cathepsin A)